MNTDTPRTDAEIREVDVAYEGFDGLSSFPEQYVSLDFARELEREIAALREWIFDEGERTNTCTYNILNEICSTCKCDRANPKKQ